MAIVPTPRSLFLCESYTKHPNEKLDLRGVFNSIRPIAGYPHRRNPFCIFAQLTNGLGRVPFFVDIRHVATNNLVFTFAPQILTFGTRMSIVNLALQIDRCEFDLPGLYLIELFCDNSWVCDTKLTLK